MQAYKLLEALRDRFTDGGEDGLPSEDIILAKKGTKGLETDLLLTFHTAFGRLSGTAQGEYRFLDFTEVGFYVFDVRILLTEEIAQDLITMLCINIGLINKDLDFGSFAFDPFTSSLYFRAQIPLVTDLSDDEMIEEAERTAVLSLDTAARFAGTLWDSLGV